MVRRVIFAPEPSRRLIGFPVAIGVDFLLITLLIGMGTRPGAYLLDWLVVVAVSILIHGSATPSPCTAAASTLPCDTPWTWSVLAL